MIFVLNGVLSKEIEHLIRTAAITESDEINNLLAPLASFASLASFALKITSPTIIEI